MWDFVVISASNEMQARVYENQIALKKSVGQITSTVSIHVFPDPEGPVIGSGGSTVYCLHKLVQLYSADVLMKKILIIHAGGFSKRLPSHSLFGKLFCPLPISHPSHPMDLLDLKINYTEKFCPYMVNGGVFVTASDDIETFSLEGLSPDDFSGFEGVVALAHPSSLKIGSNHGVYVLPASPPMNSPAFYRDDCTEVLQKPPVDLMRERGCVTERKGQKTVYSDSAFWITSSVAAQLIILHNHPDIYRTETCIYADFLTALGTSKTKYRENIIKDCDSLRQDYYHKFKDTPLRILVLENSNFYHLGTIREYIENLTVNDELKKAYNFCTVDSENIVRSAIMHSQINEKCYFSDCVIEFSKIDTPVVAENNVLSNIAISNCEKVVIPPGWLFHTVHIRESDKVLYATLALHGDDDPKAKSKNLKIPFGGSELSLKDFGINEEVELWSARIFKLCNTMNDSFLWTLGLVERKNECKEDGTVYLSMGDMIKLSDYESMREFRFGFLKQIEKE